VVCDQEAPTNTVVQIFFKWIPTELLGAVEAKRCEMRVGEIVADSTKREFHVIRRVQHQISVSLAASEHFFIRRRPLYDFSCIVYSMTLT
jgi:hypothetical protein